MAGDSWRTIARCAGAAWTPAPPRVPPSASRSPHTAPGSQLVRRRAQQRLARRSRAASRAIRRSRPAPCGGTADTAALHTGCTSRHWSYALFPYHNGRRSHLGAVPCLAATAPAAVAGDALPGPAQHHRPAGARCPRAPARLARQLEAQPPANPAGPGPCGQPRPPGPEPGHLPHHSGCRRQEASAAAVRHTARTSRSLCT